jgi:hypothetical protein
MSNMIAQNLPGTKGVVCPFADNRVQWRYQFMG